MVPTGKGAIGRHWQAAKDANLVAVVVLVVVVVVVTPRLLAARGRNTSVSVSGTSNGGDEGRRRGKQSHDEEVLDGRRSDSSKG